MSEQTPPTNPDAVPPPQQPQPAMPAAAAADAPPARPERRPMHRRPAFAVFFLALAALAVGGGSYYLYARHFEETDDAFIDGHIVPVMPQVPARVKSITFDDNSRVARGDPLVYLDPTDYRVAVEQAQGSEAAMAGKLEQAKAGVPSAQSAVAEAQAQVEAAGVTAQNANDDYERYQHLDPGSKSKQQSDNATAAKKRADADLVQAQAHLRTAQAAVTGAEANVQAAAGDLAKAHADTERAKVNLGYCTIVAPCDGKVTNKAVEPGMYVTSSNQLFQVVAYDVWVTANYKETQLARMAVGQHVTFDVDAYPGRNLTGTVQSVQSGTGSRFSIIPAENATGNFVKVVQRVPVKITLDGDPNHADPEHLLSPGMSVEPSVRIR